MLFHGPVNWFRTSKVLPNALSWAVLQCPGPHVHLHCYGVSEQTALCVTGRRRFPYHDWQCYSKQDQNDLPRRYLFSQNVSMLAVFSNSCLWALPLAISFASLNAAITWIATILEILTPWLLSQLVQIHYHLFYLYQYLFICRFSGIHFGSVLLSDFWTPPTNPHPHPPPLQKCAKLYFAYTPVPLSILRLG